jgi:integrase
MTQMNALGEAAAEPHPRRRLRRAPPTGSATGTHDEDAAGALGRAAPRPRRRDRDDHAAPQIPRPRRQAVPGTGADALRTAIAKACKAEGIPLFSPHDLRHRRISLLHLRGVPWARIGEQVGQRNLAVTANTYTHVLADETELDYATLIEEGT